MSHRIVRDFLCHLYCKRVVVLAEQGGEIIAVVLEGPGRPFWVHWLQRPAVPQRPLPRLPLRHHKQPVVIARESVRSTAAIAQPAFLLGVLISTVFIFFWLTYSRNKKKKKCGDSSFSFVSGWNRLSDICSHTPLLFVWRDGRELKENEEDVVLQ